MDNQKMSISVQELNQLFHENPGICLIDVRTAEEWLEGHIPHAKHLPKDKLQEVIISEEPLLSEPIYLYCRAGIRSQQAALDLVQLGYQAVYSVDGGITAWLQAGYPIQSP